MSYETGFSRLLYKLRSIAVPDLAEYEHDPLGYADNVLGVNWWAKQQEVATKLLTPPYRVLVGAAHSVGKTMLAGGLVNWFYDVHPDSIVLTTAPTHRQVVDLLWKEVRTQRRGRGGFTGPKEPRLESGPAHFAHGFTAKDANAFQGHHPPHLLIVFDEAVGVDHVFWEAAEGMFGGTGHAMLCIYNRTDQASAAFVTEQRARQDGSWHIVDMSAMDHPNIKAELAGKPAPYPSAIRLHRLDAMLRAWSTPLGPHDAPTPLDVEWPADINDLNGPRIWLRPGPVAESRLLARWPTQAVNAVWSEAVWTLAESTVLKEPDHLLPEIGCDVARFGDDNTDIHVRRGGVSLHHESHNGWATNQTAARLKALCHEFGQVHAKKVKVKIDDSGVGGAVVDQREDYTFIGVNASARSSSPEEYPNLRSELWFVVPELARRGLVSFARLSPHARIELRRQFMAPFYTLDGSGRRVVEEKKHTKARIGRSPDAADAVNLAYLTLPANYSTSGPSRLKT